ncbi:unnamed protein product [Porites evermanni]|uniref:Uncharacterized protein n=1 Tax=Porites evermanni TaxID=104178 RepID=A0ABN8LQJ7_9CNID|nr:unnamed protein product [Porites evermanni]
MKGILNCRPPKPRYSYTWDVKKVTAHLASLGSNNSLSLKQLSRKLVMLFALAYPLFISYAKPHKAISSATMGRWLRLSIQDADINTNIFKAHSLRQPMAVFLWMRL